MQLAGTQGKRKRQTGNLVLIVHPTTCSRFEKGCRDSSNHRNPRSVEPSPTQTPCSRTTCDLQHKSNCECQSTAIFLSDSPFEALLLRRAVKTTLSSWLNYPRLCPALPARYSQDRRAGTWGRDNSAVNQIYCKKPNL